MIIKKNRLCVFVCACVHVCVPGMRLIVSQMHVAQFHFDLLILDTETSIFIFAAMSKLHLLDFRINISAKYESGLFPIFKYFLDFFAVISQFVVVALYTYCVSTKAE